MRNRANSFVGDEKMSDFFEIIMIISFGTSWPMNVAKSYRSRTAKGKSLGFYV